MRPRALTSGNESRSVLDRALSRLGFGQRQREVITVPASPTVPDLPTEEAYRADWNGAAQTDALTAILALKGESATSDALFDDAGRRDVEWLRQYVKADSVVLDVGCGVGRLERHLAPHCAKICAIDVSDEMISRAQAWTAGISNVEFTRTSATDLSMFADATFDLAFSFLVLQHLDHQDAFIALREIARVLRPGAPALLQFPNIASPGYAAAFVQQAIARDRAPGRVRFYTQEFAERVVTLAGLEVVNPTAKPDEAAEESEIYLQARRPIVPPVGH